MTSRKFPLPLSSLADKKTTRSNKANAAGVAVETPQTATTNAAQVHMRRSNASTKDLTATSALNNKTPARRHTDEAPKPQLLASDSFAAPRRAMVNRLAQLGIQDSVVLSGLNTVPRHLFIEPAMSAQAYVDASLPIGYEQTISQPYIVARMIEILRNGRQLNNVLEIGTGCGYQAAVLAEVSKEVYSIERIRSLHELAKKNLRSLRIANLRLHYGDGMHGLPQVAPFDGIILAAAGMRVPDALLQQLALGGRLVAPVGEKQQVLQLIERTGTAHWTTTVLEGCFFVPLCSGII